MGSASGEQNNPSLVRSAQQALKQKGFDVGSVDGEMGPNTESAIRNFQQSHGLTQSGNLDQQTLSALGVEQNGNSGSSMSGSQPQGSMQHSPTTSSSNPAK